MELKVNETELNERIKRGERIKEIRKFCGLTQQEFAARLAVTDGAVSALEKGKRNFSNQLALSICREFNINEGWLREGTGKMLAEDNDNAIAEITAEYGLDELDQQILKAYINLPEDRRKPIKNFIFDIARTLETGKSPEFAETARLIGITV